MIAYSYTLKAVVTTLVLLFLTATPAKAELFVCLEQGERIMKSYESCKGKIIGVYAVSGSYQSYKEYQIEHRQREAALEKIRNSPPPPPPSLEELKAHCSQDFDDLSTHPPSGNVHANAALIAMTKDKCATTSVQCFLEYEDAMEKIKSGRGPGSVNGVRNLGALLRAKCGIAGDSSDYQTKGTSRCIPDGTGAFNCN